MSGRIEARLAALGLVLPGPHLPHDPLDAVVVHGGRARTSGQLPRGLDGKLVHPGVLGREVATFLEEADPSIGSTGSRIDVGKFDKDPAGIGS